jgi:type II secretory pathway pseudopilin PulG
MATHIKISNCRFRSSRRPRDGTSDGMVLLIVMAVATLLLIALTATLPSVYQEGQREREEELIFRGTQYGRAVALFHKQFGRYPASTKELLQTNGMRFLRQEYRDPLDPKGKWRFIHVNAAGVLLDSINQPLGNNCGNPAGLGQTSSTSSMQGGGSSFGSSSFGSSSMGSSSMGGGGSSAGCSNSMGTQGGLSGMGSNSTVAGSSQIGPTSSFFGSSSNQIQGAFIAGVAATSHHESIKIWQKHHHYDEWEFLGIDMGIFGIQVGMPGVSSGPVGMGQQSTSQGFGSSQGSFGSSNSSSSFGSSNSSPSFGSPSN